MITIDAIKRHVAASFGIPIIEMTSARRARAVARPRQVAMSLARSLTSRSLPEIGRAFGNRDHTTVMWAVDRIEQVKTLDPEFAALVALIVEELQTEPEHV